jgi:flagellar biosynthesis protein FliP
MTTLTAGLDPAPPRRAVWPSRRAVAIVLGGLLTVLALSFGFGTGSASAATAANVTAAAAANVTAATAANVSAATGAREITATTAASAPVQIVAAAPFQAHPIQADPAAPTAPAGPKAPTAPSGSSTDGSTISVNVGSKPSQSLNILLLVTVLAVAPSMLLLVTSFTKIFVVLSLTRNALGLTTVPPNQVLAGLSLFLSLFIMGPVLSKVNSAGIQPYLHGTKTRSAAWTDGVAPLRQFMLEHTRAQEIALMLRAGNLPNPANKDSLQLTTLIPAFVLSELRAAMIIGFVVYIPFVIIDLVVSSSLMSLGMMMLPPVSVSLPFKLLLFVLVDGWGLIVTALVQSYHTG